MAVTAPVIKASIRREFVIGYPASLREAERLLRFGARLSPGSELCPLKVLEAVSLGTADHYVTQERFSPIWPSCRDCCDLASIIRRSGWLGAPWVPVPRSARL